MGLVCKKFNRVGSREQYVDDFPQLEVEGAKELSILCPASQVTGFPCSMQRAIFLITDKNERLADVLYQEIPYVMSSDKVSDDDKLKLLVSRLDSGSFAENDDIAGVLGRVAKQFFPAANVEDIVDQAQQKINFESGDAPDSNS